MVLTKGICLVAGGVGIGLLVSFAVTRLLASEFSGVSHRSWTFGAVAPSLRRRRPRQAISLPSRHARRSDGGAALRVNRNK